MWQAPLGHGRDDIVDAYAKQARAVASAGPIGFTTEGAAELAWRLAESTPGDLNRVFLTSSRLRGDRDRGEARAPVPPPPRRPPSLQVHLPLRLVPRGRDGRHLDRRPAPARRAVLPAAAGDRERRAADGRRRRRRGRGDPDGDRDGGARDRRRGHRRARRDHPVHDPRRRLLAARPRDLRRVRRPADRRRDADRLLPERPRVGRPALGRHAGRARRREGRQCRVRARRRDDRPRPDLRRVRRPRPVALGPELRRPRRECRGRRAGVRGLRRGADGRGRRAARRGARGAAPDVLHAPARARPAPDRALDGARAPGPARPANRWHAACTGAGPSGRC